MADDNDKDRNDARDGIEKVFDKVADAFNKFAQGPQGQKPKPPGDTDAFFRAVKRNNVGEVQKFIDAGINLNVTSSGGDTALHICARNNLTDVGLLLLEAGANPKVPHCDDAQRTPLADAVNFGKPEMAELLTRYGGYAPGQAASNGFTLLHRACEKGNPRLVEAMITAGADSNEKTGNGATPLLVAIVQRQTAVAEKLLEFTDVMHGVNEYFVLTDPRQRTAFQLAIEKGQSTLVAKMLAFGSNVNAADAEGLTPLHRAILKADLPLVKTLIANGADINKQAGGSKSALYLACQSPDITDGKLRGAIVDYLLRQGADPDQPQPGTKTTPLHAAILSASGKETVEALLAYPGNRNQPDEEGFQPVFYTIHKSDTNLLKQMLDAGCDVNARHMVNARTPLIQAVHESSAPAVALLLSKGANPKLFDSHGKSALSYARDKKLTEIVALLETALTKKDKPKFQEWSL
ncbi:MAG: ankyrin repeat domain-containing protein [Alphaproteobacteria bacterium]